MVLLDLIDLRLKEEGVGGGGQWGGDDSDEDGFGDEEEDEEEDGVAGGVDARSRRLRRVALHPCPERPGTFWAVHDRGAWALGLRWLPAVARQFAAAAAAEAEGFGGLDAYQYGGSAGGGGGGDDEAESGSLPAPVLRELLVSEEGLVGSVPVSSVMAGSSCALLERSGQLSLARPGTLAAGGGGAAAGVVEAERERLERLMDGGGSSGGAGGQQLPDAAAAQAAVQVSFWAIGFWVGV